jgi:phage terminase large subunit-like protein
MTTLAPVAQRVAPGVVQVGRDPVVLGVRPLEGVRDVWECLVDDRDGSEPRMILTQGPRVIRFLERFCVHTQARWAGVPFRCLGWQKHLLCELFEVEWSDERGRYVRRYHEALIGTPKKNGKSDLLGGLGLYFLVADNEPSPIVIAAAANETSARLVFTPAKTMVELSSGADVAYGLSNAVDAFDRQLFLRDEPNAELRKVPASPQSVEGLSIHANLMDEWHEWTTPASEQTATKLMNGTVLRPDYMNIRTTTAGHDIESLCGQDYEFGLAVAAREVDAPEWFFRWYEAPREVERGGKVVELDWRSEEAVRLANPSYGELAAWDYYERRLRRVREGIYRRYHLNQWTSTEEAWLPSGALAACEAPQLELAPGWPTAIGWDAATKHDSTAVVIMQRQQVRDAETDEMVTRVVTRAYIWERPLDPETRKPAADWRLPIDEVDATVVDLWRVYHPKGIPYDPAFITWEASKLSELGLPMVEFSQSSIQKLCQASQLLYELIITGQLAHDGDPAFVRHMDAAVAKQTSGGSAAWQLVKGKARKKMDAAVAAAMAAWFLEHGEDPPAPKRPPRLFALGLDDDDAEDG